MSNELIENLLLVGFFLIFTYHRSYLWLSDGMFDFKRECCRFNFLVCWGKKCFDTKFTLRSLIYKGYNDGKVNQIYYTYIFIYIFLPLYIN